MVEEWEKLNREYQDIYLNKARFLLEKGYYEDIEIEDLAIKIYHTFRLRVHDTEKD